MLLRADIGRQGKRREDHFLLVVNRCFSLLRVIPPTPLLLRPYQVVEMLLRYLVLLPFFQFPSSLDIEKAQVETPVTVW